MKCSYCIVPVHARARGLAAARRARRRGRAAGRRRRARGHAARPERQLLRPRAAAAAAHVRRAAARGRRASTGIDRIRYTSPHPAHMTRGRDPRARGAREPSASTSTCRCRPAPRAVLKRDAPHLHARALPRPRRADPRARARTARSRPTSSSASRGRPRRTSRETLEVAEEVGFDGAFTFIYSPRRDTEAAEFVDEFVPHEVAGRAHGAARRGRPAARPRARPALRRPHARRARRGRLAPRPVAACAAARRHNKVVNFDGLAAPGEIVPVEITARRASRCGRGVAARCGEPRDVDACVVTAAPSRWRSHGANTRPRSSSVRAGCANICSCAGASEQVDRTEDDVGPASPGVGATAGGRGRFDAPEALDTRFHEVRTKSALNRVPAAVARPVQLDGQPVPGLLPCVHLLPVGDDAGPHGGRPDPPIEDLRSATRSIGTERRGSYRRYVTHARCSTTGRRSSPSGGHARGRHRAPGQRRPPLPDRARLEARHELGVGFGRVGLTSTLEQLTVGTGHFADPPRQTSDYKRGYLCGLIRGDGHLRSVRRTRSPSGRAHRSHRFRLALADFEALRRAQLYLEELGAGAARVRCSQAAVGELPRDAGDRAPARRRRSRTIS